MSAAPNPVAVGPTVPHETYLGGSDIGAVLGLSPYRTQLDVWAAKTRRGPKFDNARTRSGNRFERVILENYTEDYGAVLEFPGTITHPNGITGTTPDAIANGTRNVQVKMVGYHEAPRWGVVELAEDGIPAEVLAQIHWESWHLREVRGLQDDFAHVVAQIGTEPRLYEVRIDDEFSENMIEAGMRFWRDHVVADRMPVVTAGDGDILRHLYRKGGKQLGMMTDDVESVAREYQQHQKTESAAKKLKEACGVRIMELVGEDLGFIGRGLKVTWRTQRGRIDWEKCARELGANDEVGETFRTDEIRVIDVRVLKGQ